MHSPVLPQVLVVGKLDIAGPISQRYVETTKGMTSPNFITDMNITTKIWFVPQVYRTDVTDRAMQCTFSHIVAPKALAVFPIHLDEERIDAPPLRSVAPPEFIGRDCHQSSRLIGTYQDWARPYCR